VTDTLLPRFDVDKFRVFCERLKVDTKEKGRMPLTWLGTQRYFVEEIAEGINRDVHQFVVLKGRQLGISTVSLALDLYWLFKHEGLQGMVVTDTDDNRDLFRSHLEQYMASLPPRFKPETGKSNRGQMILSNSSRLMYLVAGVRKSGNLGRAKSANFMHATECSSWGDEEGFASLMNSLAQVNPNRLYIFESTARGYDMFYEAWEAAKKSKTQKAIFIGWWRNELYRKERNTVEFQTYWDGEPTSDERVWIGEIFGLYGYEIKPEQLAWWRWYVVEQMRGDEMMALQEMPPTEEYAFQLSGSKFFSAERTNHAYQTAIKQERMFFRYRFGMNFEDTEFIETTAEQAEVSIWEWPDEKGVYALGCDPAYGSSEWADEFAGCMLRCYADKVVQVLEIGTPDWTEQQFAWVIAHLAGFYRNTMLSLEMQGPGGAVFNELNNLKRMAGTMKQKDPRRGPFEVVGNIRDYLWKKQDSMTGSYALQWQTNAREKIRMYTTTRSYFEREMVVINSPECLGQFRNIHRQGDQIGGEGRAKDDRVTALCIAIMAWNDNLMLELQGSNKTFILETRTPEEIARLSPIENGVLSFLQKQGIRMPGLKRVD
jgi:hypothetical protein